MSYENCEKALARCLKAKIYPEIINVITYNNATKDNIEAVKEYIKAEISFAYTMVEVKDRKAWLENYYEALKDIIFIAAMHNQFDLVHHLISSYGDEMEKHGVTGNYSLLHLAARFGAVDFIAYLIDGGKVDLNHRDPLHNNERPITTAIKAGQLVILKLLVAKGFNLKKLCIERDRHLISVFHYPDNEPPLHAAARFGHYPVVKYLIEQGIDIYAIENLGFMKKTLLHSVAEHVCDERVDSPETIKAKILLIKYLITQGINVHAKNKCGNTVLHIAAGSCQVDIVRFLINNTELDINSANDRGDTPLSFIFRDYYPLPFDKTIPLMKVLLLAGADPAIKNLQRRSAYDYFMGYYNDNDEDSPINYFKSEFEILKQLFSRDGDYSKKLLPETKTDWKLAFFKNIVDSESQVNEVNVPGYN